MRRLEEKGSCCYIFIFHCKNQRTTLEPRETYGYRAHHAVTAVRVQCLPRASRDHCVGFVERHKQGAKGEERIAY